MEETSLKAYIQMPVYQGGNLRQWLQTDDASNARKRQKLIYGLLQAVERVHTAGVLHNDMKLENVLLTEGAEDAVLSDFEFSNAAGGVTTTVIGGGTAAYMSPERKPPPVGTNAKPTTRVAVSVPNVTTIAWIGRVRSIAMSTCVSIITPTLVASATISATGKCC